MQLDKFTLKSQEAIQTALNHAQDNGNQEIQPEHLLKAILEQPGGVVAPVLQKMGIQLRNRIPFDLPENLQAHIIEDLRL